METEKVTYHKVISNDSSIDIRERRELLSEDQLKLPHDWGVNGVEVIASRVRIYWLPHHWNFILKCKKTDRSVVISREDFGLDICLCDSFQQAKDVSSMYRLNDKALKIQDWIFGWDHKTSYVYNRFKNGPDKAKEIWRKNFGLHDEF